MTHSDRGRPSAPRPPVLSVRDLAKVYGRGPASVRAVDGVSLDLDAGTFTAVMGQSGSEKSTLLQCAAGLHAPTSGTVILADTTLAGAPEGALTALRRSRVGFVFQAYNHVSARTVRENILLPTRLARARWGRRLADIAERVGLTDRLRHRPAQLSGGEQQRVAIARALFTNPDAAFCGEPASWCPALSPPPCRRVLRYGRCRSKRSGCANECAGGPHEGPGRATGGRHADR